MSDVRRAESPLHPRLFEDCGELPFALMPELLPQRIMTYTEDLIYTHTHTHTHTSTPTTSTCEHCQPMTGFAYQARPLASAQSRASPNVQDRREPPQDFESPTRMETYTPYMACASHSKMTPELLDKSCSPSSCAAVVCASTPQSA